MRFLLINLTNDAISITRTSLEKVTIASHKHYLLETLHNPEINFWQNCADRRFRVITNQDEINRYLKVVSNQEKSQEKSVIKETPTETISDAVSKPKLETPATNNVEENENVPTKYTEDKLVTMKVTELKALASQLKITIPNGANKASIISLIIENQ